MKIQAAYASENAPAQRRRDPRDDHADGKVGHRGNALVQCRYKRPGRNGPSARFRFVSPVPRPADMGSTRTGPEIDASGRVHCNGEWPVGPPPVGASLTHS